MSKDRNKIQMTHTFGPNSQSRQGINLHSAEIQSIIKLKNKFQKNVEQTVLIIQEISQNKLPHKCLTHNNNLSLYCQNDCKPLCANCIYQNLSHKNHKILPLTHCELQIKRDCDRLQKQLDNFLDNIMGVVKHVNQGILKLQKEHPHLVWKIQDSYKKLHEFLVDRQREHLRELKYHTERMKYQHGALSTQLNNIAVFIEEKMSNYRKKTDSQSILSKRCVYQSLKNSAKIVSDELNTNNSSDHKLNFTVFTEVEGYIHSKMPKLFYNDAKTQSQKGLYSRSSTKMLNSKSKDKLRNNQRQSFSPITKANKSPQPTKRPKDIDRRSESPQQRYISRSISNKKITPQKVDTNRQQKRQNQFVKTPQKNIKDKSNQKILQKSSSKNQNSINKQQMVSSLKKK